MKQALSAQFDQIEQANRQKVLAELKLKVAKPLVEKLIASAEKKISPPVCIDSDDLEILQQAFLEWRLNNRTRKLHDFLPSSFLEKINQLGYEIVFAQAGVGLERMIIDRKPPRDTLMVGLSSASHSLMYCYYKTYQGDERWTPNTWYEVSIDSPDAADEQTVHQLEELGQIDEVHLKTISTPPPTVLPNLVSAAPQAEYKPKPIIQKSTDNIQSSIKYAVLLAEMQKKTYTIDQAELRINVIKSEVEKIKQNMNTIDDDFIDISSACVKHVQDCIRKIISEREVFYANRVDKHVFIFLMNKSLVLLEQLMRLDMYDEVRKDLAQSITEIQHTQKAYVSNTVVESQTPMLISGEQPVDKKQESVIPWWIWPVAIFIGFVIDIRLGIGLCVAAILWGIFKVFMIFPAFFGFVIFFGFLWIVFSA